MRRSRTSAHPAATVLALAACLFLQPSAGKAHGEKETEGGAPGIQHSLGPAGCVDGMAGEFPCRRVDLLSAVPVADMGGERANDIWGWTDPATGREYALVGLFNGVAFVDVSDPEAPLVIGLLPTHTESSSWRDLKVYEDHVFIARSEIEGFKIAKDGNYDGLQFVHREATTHGR